MAKRMGIAEVSRMSRSSQGQDQLGRGELRDSGHCKVSAHNLIGKMQVAHKELTMRVRGYSSQ